MGSADTAQLDRLQFKWENSKYLWYFAEPRLSIFFLARNSIFHCLFPQLVDPYEI